LPLTDKSKAELKHCINSTKKSKWDEYRKLISTALDTYAGDDKEALMASMSAFSCDCILENLGAIKDSRRPSIIQGIKQLLPKRPTEDRMADFLQDFSEHLKNNDDTQFVNFCYDVIIDMIIECCNRRLWSYSLIIVQRFNIPEILNSNRLDGLYIVPEDPQVLNAVRFINYLGINAVKHSARGLPVSGYESVLPPNDPDVVVFLRNFREIQSRFVLAHTWSIQGESQGIKLEGGRVELYHKEIISTIQHIQQNNKTEQLEKISANVPDLARSDIEKIIQSSDQQTINIDKSDVRAFHNQTFLETPNKSLICIVHTKANELTEEGHGMAFAFWRDQFAIYERGGVMGSYTGVRIYKIDDNLRNYLFEYAVSRSPADTIEETLSNSELMQYIPMKKQVTGNCIWVAAKGSYWLAVYYNTLQLISEKGLTFENPADVAHKMANACYKYLSDQKRILDVVSYINLESANKDEELLSKVLAKIQRPSWQRRGMAPLMPLFSDKVKARASSIIISDLQMAIQTADMEKVEQLLPLALNTGKIQSVNLLELSIALAAKKIHLPEQEFSQFLDILRALIVHQIPFVDDFDKYLCAEHYFNTFMESKDIINETNKSNVVSLIQSSYLSSFGALNYNIITGNITRVKELTTQLQNAKPDQLMSDDLYPIETALRVALNSNDDSELVFKDRMVIIDNLIENNIVSAHTTVQDTVEQILKELPEEIKQETIFKNRCGLILSSLQEISNKSKNKLVGN